ADGYRFRRQVPIGGFIADFVCQAARLIVEIDGGQHDLSSEEEAGRTRFLEGEGYRVLRVWNNEVLENAEGVRAVIGEHLHRVAPTHVQQVTPTHLERVTPTHLERVTPTPSLPHRGGGLKAPLGDVADPERVIADLQRQLDECRAELAARNSAYG